MEVELMLMIDFNLFLDFVGYFFGWIEEKFNSLFILLDVFFLDMDGKSIVIGMIDDVGEIMLLLRVCVCVVVFEFGGCII